VTDDLHLAGRNAPVEVGHSRAHLAVCSLGPIRIAGNPQAGFLAFEASSEVRDQDLGEIVGRRVKLADMIAGSEPIKIGTAAGAMHSSLRIQP
jgi:hypothetical protein